MTGAYTQIVEVVAPSEAVAGDTVNIEVKVKNLYSSSVHITVTGRVGDAELHFGNIYHTVAAGSIQSFYDSFIMPGSAVTLQVWSFYWTGTEWYQDDEASKSIPLTGVFAGTISQKKLEYNAVHTPIPASNIPQGKRGLVHIWGRNDTASFQSLGIGWLVTDPDGIVVETHENDWAFGLVGGGQDREFIGGRFDLSKVGTYSIGIILYENSSDPVEVDRYEGDLCNVIAVVEVETLEVDITPVGTGHVTTVPASEEGKTTWYNGDTGTFPYDTKVQVTAHPSTGYAFEKWSDEIVGGVSYGNPSYVQDMTEHRAVKCHFRVVGEEPTFTDFKIEAVDGQPIPLSEIITKGIGEALKVAYSFKYKVISPITIDIWASLYQITRTEKAQTKTAISLDKALDWKTYEGEIDIAIGEIGAGIYGVICELPDYGVEDKIDDCINITAPPSVFEMIGPILVLGILAAIIPSITKEGSK